MESTSCRVLSIQSHVVSGYVGNKSATFPLQVLGFEVDTINSVQFSNHTGYGVFKGQVLNSNQLDDLFDGLKQNNIHHYTHLLTGYVGDPTFLEKVAEVVIELKKINPGLIYVCDPVMGDEGKMYVPQSLLPIYREKILPLADIITPNQYEAELLSETSIKTEADAMKTMEILHEKGPKTVVISSSDLGNDDILLGVGMSIKNGSKNGIRIEIPRLITHFTGTGDLFAALLLAWLHQHPDNLKLACEKVIATMQSVLRRTESEAKVLAGPGVKPTVAQRELKLIQSKRDIESPNIIVHATSS